MNSKILQVLASRLGGGEEMTKKMAELLREPEVKEGEAYNNYEKEVEALLPQLERLGTKDYFSNDPEVIKGIKGRVSAEIYDGASAQTRQMLTEMFSDIVSENDLDPIFKNRNLKYSDKSKQALALIKQGFSLKEKSFKTETPENFQNALSEKDNVINQLRTDFTNAKLNHEKELQNRERNFELELIKGSLKGEIGKLPLANRNQTDLAQMLAWNNLSENFHLKRGGKGEIQLFQKDNPDLPANDTSTKTALSLESHLTNLLNTNGLLARNNGGGVQDQKQTGANKLPDGKNKYDLPAGVDPNSEAARKFLKYRGLAATGQVNS